MITTRQLRFTFSGTKFNLYLEEMKSFAVWYQQCMSKYFSIGKNECIVQLLIPATNDSVYHNCIYDVKDGIHAMYLSVINRVVITLNEFINDVTNAIVLAKPTG